MENFSYLKALKHVLFGAAFLLFSCTTQPSVTIKEPFRVGAWMGVNANTPKEKYEATFAKLQKAGFTEVLINTGTNPDILAAVTPVAKSYGLDVHAWMFTMNRPGDPIALEHPEWYTVSREGKSCFDTRPYVNYYQWLCPSRPEAVDHILSLVEGLADVPEVSSVHLDYIRFVDIFLPIGLLPKYDLVQNQELPEFDFCYCEVCRNKFKETHHRDPLELEHPELDVEWRQFRLNAIRDVVNKAYQRAHEKGKLLTSAVFPYPTMAANMVRQRWDKWDIDRVYPMLYHNFYNEEIDWIGFATAQGIADLKDKNTTLSSGVFVPALTPEEIPELIRMVKSKGAAGITFFDAGALKQEHLDQIEKTLSEFK